MLNDDEQYYMECEFTGYYCRDSTPIEYETEAHSDDADYKAMVAEMIEAGLDPENDDHWELMDNEYDYPGLDDQHDY